MLLFIMTLCIADKIGPSVILASDSRITLGNMHSDYAIKVLPINIRIYEPAESETGNKKLIFSSSFGFASAGDFASQNALKDFLVIIFQELTYIPTFGPLSFNLICSFILEIYEKISSDIYEKLGISSIDFFICGTCPDSGAVNLAKFTIAHNPETGNPIVDHAIYNADKDFPIAIGSGEDKFHEYYKTYTQGERKSLKALHDVIADDSIPSVGGNIQYGVCDPRQPFTVHGIVKRDKYHDGSLSGNRFFIGAIDVLDDLSEDSGLFIPRTFIFPID